MDTNYLNFFLITAKLKIKNCENFGNFYIEYKKH